MADQVARLRQYEYRANSNLVLTTDQHRPRQDEPSGEPESLKDHLQNTKFGDRVAYGKPDVDGGARKRKAAAAAAAKADATKRTRKDGATVLDLGDDLDTYRPRSKETRGAYEELLSLISQQLGILLKVHEAAVQITRRHIPPAIFGDMAEHCGRGQALRDKIFASGLYEPIAKPRRDNHERAFAANRLQRLGAIVAVGCDFGFAADNLFQLPDDGLIPALTAQHAARGMADHHYIGRQRC